MRFLLRAFGLLFLAGAFAAAVVDAARSLADQEFTMTSTGLALATLFPAKFELWSTTVQARAPHILWDPVLLSILYAPTFVILGLVGLVVNYLSRPPAASATRSILNH
jgi:hypothetical protein